MSTFRPKVDYSLRPGKATVRHMVVEALARLGALQTITNYRYVGMGSIFFRDFLLVHRRLGIYEMTTIEGDSNARDRIKFNLPLSSIKPIMQSTSNALLQIPLEEQPYIAWLDYESRINSGVLADVEEFVGRSAATSVLIVTVNADRLLGDKLDRWLSELGEDRPAPRHPQTRREFTLLTYRVLCKAIEEALLMRNSALHNDLRVDFHQIFHLIHADNAQMLTLGGALVAKKDHSKWVECGIDSLDFTRPDDAPLKVKIPLLTRREVHHLLACLPGSSETLRNAALNAGIPSEDAREFAKVHRHAPLFIEAEGW